MLSDIGVVIINWNTKQYLLDGIASYLDNGIQLERIATIDQGSIHGSGEAVHENIRISEFAHCMNTGYGHAANVGAQLLETDYVIIANADMAWFCPEHYPVCA